ncbi:MAG: hypothetical protein ACE5J3_12285 [Methanosarcinales archaeon]
MLKNISIPKKLEKDIEKKLIGAYYIINLARYSSATKILLFAIWSKITFTSLILILATSLAVSAQCLVKLQKTQKK